jgi:hypothetical protein
MRRRVALWILLLWCGRPACMETRAPIVVRASRLHGTPCTNCGAGVPPAWKRPPWDRWTSLPVIPGRTHAPGGTSLPRLKHALDLSTKPIARERGGLSDVYPTAAPDRHPGKISSPLTNHHSARPHGSGKMNKPSAKYKQRLRKLILEVNNQRLKRSRRCLKPLPVTRKSGRKANA